MNIVTMTENRWEYTVCTVICFVYFKRDEWLEYRIIRSFLSCVLCIHYITSIYYFSCYLFLFCPSHFSFIPRVKIYFNSTFRKDSSAVNFFLVFFHYLTQYTDKTSFRKVLVVHVSVMSSRTDCKSSLLLFRSHRPRLPSSLFSNPLFWSLVYFSGWKFEAPSNILETEIITPIFVSVVSLNYFFSFVDS